MDTFDEPFTCDQPLDGCSGGIMYCVQRPLVTVSQITEARTGKDWLWFQMSTREASYSRRHRILFGCA